MRLQALHILLRGHIHFALEELSEVLDVAEATHLRHLHHVGLILLESLYSLVDLIVVDKFDEGHAGHLLQFLVERGMTHGELLRQEVHIEVGIARDNAAGTSALPSCTCACCLRGRRSARRCRPRL